MTARGARIEAGVVVSMIMTKCLIPNDLQRNRHGLNLFDDKKTDKCHRERQNLMANAVNANAVSV